MAGDGLIQGDKQEGEKQEVSQETADPEDTFGVQGPPQLDERLAMWRCKCKAKAVAWN